MGKPQPQTKHSKHILRSPEATDASDGDKGWRVELLRGLVRGDLELVIRSLHDHIDVLSLPFTKVMPAWKVQWESIHWWMLRDATPLVIAAAYSQPEIVHELLLRGADRTSKGYLGRTPLEFVGECCEHSSTATGGEAERSAACRRLLTAPPALPSPPMDHVKFSCDVATQVVVVPSSSSSARSSSSTKDQGNKTRDGGGGGGAAAATVTQAIYKCLVGVVWDAPLSNGALIDMYELRYRQLVDDGDDQSLISQGSSGWRVEKAPHNRKTRQQGTALEGLQFDTSYEFMLRSSNAAGKGDWGRAYKFRTVVSPETTTATSNAPQS